MMMKKMKRRRFGSIGGRVDATSFLVFLSLSLSRRVVVVVVARVYVYSRAFFLSLSRFSEELLFRV